MLTLNFAPRNVEVGRFNAVWCNTEAKGVASSDMTKGVKVGPGWNYEFSKTAAAPKGAHRNCKQGDIEAVRHIEIGFQGGEMFESDWVADWATIRRVLFVCKEFNKRKIIVVAIPLGSV